MTESHAGETRLFLLRMWLRDDSHVGEEGAAHMWSGKVQLVGGEARAFTGWDEMIVCLETMLSHGPSERKRAPQAEHNPPQSS